MRPDNTRFLIQAARQRSQATRQRAIQALRDLAAAGTPVTFQTVAGAAGVSRSWLYGQPDLRAEPERLRALSARAPRSDGYAPTTTSSASSSPARSGNAAPPLVPPRPPAPP